MKNKKVRQVALIAMLIALYFVLSAMLKIPVGGHITLDLGYVALMVGAVYLGAVPAMIIGGMGAFLESLLMSQRGVSPGWIVMNVIAGGLIGWVLHRITGEEKKKFILAALIVVPLATLLGAAAKMFIDCAMYDLPLALKIPTTAIAWITDSVVMLALGLPMSLALMRRLRWGKR